MVAVYPVRVPPSRSRAVRDTGRRPEGNRPMASDFKEKFNQFMARRNGPDQLARDALILAIVLLILGALVGDMLGSLLTVFGFAAMVYSYWRMFSTKVSQRTGENYRYVDKRTEILNKVKAPFRKAAQQGQKAASQAKTQAKDKEHRYFACPKCGQTVRVPKGAGKIRVTCPKCGEKFEKKA